VVQTTQDISGEVPITLVADDGVGIERVSLKLEIANLAITAMAPDAFVQDMSPGTTSTVVSVSGLPPYTFTCSGLPAGATCQFSGEQQPYPTASDITVTIALPSGMNPGNSSFTVTAQSGGLTAQTSETLSVFTFTMQAPAAKQDWGPSPGSLNVSFPVQVTNLAGASATVACTLDGVSVCQTTGQGVNNSTTSISEALNIPSGFTPGQHTLAVSATVAGIPQSYTFPFWIADFSGALAANSVTTSAGGSVTLTGTLTATSGFSSTIFLSCSGPLQIACNFQPSPVSLVGGAPSTFTLTLQASSVAENQPPEMESRALHAIALSLMLPAGFAVFGMRKRWRNIALYALLAAMISLAVSSCGGSGAGGTGGTKLPPPPATYSVTLIARESSFGLDHTIGTITVTVNH